jgi:hypothetical protein
MVTRARSTMSTQQGMRDALTYMPGDGYVYRWDGGQWITIHKIMYVDGGPGSGPNRRIEVEQPDVIPAPGPGQRTGTQLVAAVDQWRAR